MRIERRECYVQRHTFAIHTAHSTGAVVFIGPRAFTEDFEVAMAGEEARFLSLSLV